MLRTRERQGVNDRGRVKHRVDTFTCGPHVAWSADVANDTLHPGIAFKRCKVERANLTTKLQQTADEVLAYIAVATGH